MAEENAPPARHYLVRRVGHLLLACGATRCVRFGRFVRLSAAIRHVPPVSFNGLLVATVPAVSNSGRLALLGRDPPSNRPVVVEAKSPSAA